jgi:hypothetical protein
LGGQPDNQEQNEQQDYLDGHVDDEREQAAGEPGAGHLKDDGLAGDDLGHGCPRFLICRPRIAYTFAKG